MNALAVENYPEPQESKETRDGVIDLFSGTWVCTDHEMTMKVGRECPFCAVEAHGLDVLDELAF